MCIILTCEQFTRPDFNLIDDCFYANPDGAGLMWCEDGRVQIAKGFTDSQSLFDAIESTPIESRLVIHMRIATSGGIDVGTCHPFPICTRMEALHAANVECDAALAHNGVISGMPTSKELGISDTVAFVSLVVNDMYVNEGITKSVCRRIKKAAPGNRFAIMTSDGAVYRMGAGWETVTKGIQASNDSWAWSKYYTWSWSENGTDWESGWSYTADDRWPDEPESGFYDSDYEEIFNICCNGCPDKSACMSIGPACQIVRDYVDDWYASVEMYETAS